MKKNLYFIFIAASFALLASAPGRLAYGLPLIIELNLILAAATAFNNFVKKIDLGGLEEIASLSFIIFLAVLFKQILVLYSPVIALTLSFTIFIPAASAFLIGCVYSSQPNSVSKNAGLCAWFSAFAVLFFLLRDVLGYGTISLPSRNEIKEAVLFNSYNTSFLSFFATIPGALLMLVFFMSILLTLQNRMIVIEKSGACDDNN